MDELDNNKLKAEDDEREVESEENQRGEEIEVNEDRLPSRAMAIHEHIRQEGEKRWSAMRWPCYGQRLRPACRWGLLLAKGIFHVKLEGIREVFCWKTSATPSALLS
ncbi:hypothetical protein OVX87_08120 [Klebsiella pneumoniae]|nr:hypothetical protein [Klebsiella pneumoniae]